MGLSPQGYRVDMRVSMWLTLSRISPLKAVGLRDVQVCGVRGLRGLQLLLQGVVTCGVPGVMV